jgi:hypothetical protein
MDMVNDQPWYGFHQHLDIPSLYSVGYKGSRLEESILPSSAMVISLNRGGLFLKNI